MILRSPSNLPLSQPINTLQTLSHNALQQLLWTLDLLIDSHILLSILLTLHRLSLVLIFKCFQIYQVFQVKIRVLYCPKAIKGPEYDWDKHPILSSQNYKKSVSFKWKRACLDGKIGILSIWYLYSKVVFTVLAQSLLSFPLMWVVF